MLDLADLQKLYTEAEEASKSGKYAEALSIQNGLIEQCEQNKNGEGIRELLALTYNNRGHIKYLQVDFDEAVDDYTSAIEQNDRLAVAYYNRGLIHYRLGRFKEAVGDQEIALSLQPDFTSAKQCLDQSKQEIAEREKKES